MANRAPRGFVVYGGGRWARTLVSVLRLVLPPDTEIVWVTSHCYTDVLSWLSVSPLTNVRVVRELDLNTSRAEAVIIATSPPSHFQLLRQSLRLGLPILCEKPIVSTVSQLDELLALSESGNCPVGVHLEFLFASYLADFAKFLRPQNTVSIRLEWMDPWREPRHAEIKKAETYTDIISDQFPHCWSVLSAVLKSPVSFQLNDVSYSPQAVNLHGSINQYPALILLSRRAKNRIRRLAILEREGHESVIDFSTEPGSVFLNNLTLDLTWSGLRPLMLSLSSFADVVRTGDRSCWPLDITNCLPALNSTLIAADKLQNYQSDLVRRLVRRGTLDLENSIHVDLIVDRFLPSFAELGYRFAVDNLKEQKDFARLWFSTIAQGNL